MANIWFLNFLTCRDTLAKLAKLKMKSLLAIPAVGKKYASQVQEWQRQASFAPEVEFVSAMIQQDARRVQALNADIKALDCSIKATALDSELAQTILSIPGFGDTLAAELAGEIATMDRFESEAGLAVYTGMAALARHYPQVGVSRIYYDKKRSEGKRHDQAVRALGRHLIRVIWALVKSGRKYEERSKIT